MSMPTLTSIFFTEFIILDNFNFPRGLELPGVFIPKDVVKLHNFRAFEPNGEIFINHRFFIGYVFQVQYIDFSGVDPRDKI